MTKPKSYPPRLNPITPQYIDLVRELDEQRRVLGWSHEQLCARAGIGDRAWAHYLKPGAPGSGRLASWSTLAKVIAALFPNGFRVVPAEAPPPMRTVLSMEAGTTENGAIVR